MKYITIFLAVCNQFLENIRKTDVLVHVIRAFDNEHVIHADGSVDPLRDVETINMELLFADLAVIENRIGRIETSKKARCAASRSGSGRR